MSKLEEEYPFEGLSRLTRRARLRKRNMRLSIADVKQRQPFSRWFAFLLIANAMVTPLWWLFNAAFHIFTNDLHWFILVTLITMGLGVVGLLNRWVVFRTPETVKIKMGVAPEITAVDFHPGEHIRNIELPETSEPDGPRASFPFEFILGGGHSKVAETVSKPGKYIFIARCFERTDPITKKKLPMQSGVMKGKQYQIDRDADPHLAGDVINYRYVDWKREAIAVFGKKVKDNTYLIIGFDPLDPVTFQPPASEPNLRLELFSAKQKINKMSTERLNYYKEDKKAKKARRDEDMVIYEGTTGGKQG